MGGRRHERELAKTDNRQADKHCKYAVTDNGINVSVSNMLNKEKCYQMDE